MTRIHANPGHLCKSDRYLRKSEYELVWYSLGKEGKRKLREADKRKKENGFMGKGTKNLGNVQHLLEDGRHFLGLDVDNVERLGSI